MRKHRNKKKGIGISPEMLDCANKHDGNTMFHIERNVWCIDLNPARKSIVTTEKVRTVRWRNTSLAFLWTQTNLHRPYTSDRKNGLFTFIDLEVCLQSHVSRRTCMTNKLFRLMTSRESKEAVKWTEHVTCCNKPIAVYVRANSWKPNSLRLVGF